MKKRHIQKEIDDAIDLFESAHNITPSYDSETGNVSFTTTPNKTFLNVRKVKKRYGDYQPGAVKVYTPEEIKEYEDGR